MVVRDATIADIDLIVELIELRRNQLANWEPRFWRKAEGSADMSLAFLPSLIEDPNVTLLIATDNTMLIGCLQFKPTFVPPVYAPGGTTWMVDDFVVADGQWDTAGSALLVALKGRTVEKEEGQLVFPVPYKDEACMDFFSRNGLSATTMWWTTGSA